ncbi:MAG: GNAT family N-acetyltransferase [Ardenticatenia bacterium]|nr:GNAT family N-acetyltransferase [Ardenticatena maritima]RME11449.1 MAG: GNAT family N-acetyltransferase [Ardenticatenia bacterium]
MEHPPMADEQTYRDVSALLIHPAELDDIAACLALDRSYTTNEVWQMVLEPRQGLATLGVRFHAVRLTREVRHPYPRPDEELRALWQHDISDVLVARLGDEVVGFVDMRALVDRGCVWVHNLVVHAPFRRRGIGRQLVEAAAEWGRERGFRRFIFETPTKNGGAFQFFFAIGAEFTGFQDRYYSNQDIAVFFEYRV